MTPLLSAETAGQVGHALPEHADAVASLGLKIRPDGFESVFQSHRDLRERYFRERGWLSQAQGISDVAARVLAARATASAAMLRRQVHGLTGAAQVIFAALTASRPDIDALQSGLHNLLGDAATLGLTQGSERQIVALWPVAASVEQLLASGGDERLALCRETGLNKYHCTPWPRPDLHEFSSCTASNPSEAAFGAAEAARRALLESSLRTTPAMALADASEAISAALLRHFGVEDLAQAVLAASGTDAALVVTSLLSAERPAERLTSLIVSPAETGRGVPDAVQGRHFSAYTPSGRVVGKGQPIEGFVGRPALATVALRNEAGEPRAARDVVADIETAIETAVATGRVVLHAIDGSKTGLTAPDPQTCSRLAARFGHRLDIVIDACQARIEPRIARWYLEQGFPVLVTGSKFYGAPGFCGAVLFPRNRLAKIKRDSALPAGLGAYAWLDEGFGSRRCPGLVLRWSAALQAMAQFAQLDTAAVCDALAAFERQISLALARHPRLRLIDAPRPAGSGWSHQRSVFTIAARQAGTWLSAKALHPIYEALASGQPAAGAGKEIRFQVGQPVELGGNQLGGLRLAIGSRQLASPAEHAQALEDAIVTFGSLLDRSFT